MSEHSGNGLDAFGQKDIAPNLIAYMEGNPLSSPAIFLDRDGVINRNRPDHVKAWREFEFLPGVLRALRALAQVPWPIVVISNQSAIGRGLVRRTTVEAIHRRMLTHIRRAGGRIDRVFYCPHRPEDGCPCRKPRPGLLLQAQAALKLDLRRSLFIGDAATDVLAALAVGAYPILVQTGRGSQQLALLRQQHITGFRIADDLADAVAWILEQCLAAGSHFPGQGRTGTVETAGSPGFVIHHSSSHPPSSV